MMKTLKLLFQKHSSNGGVAAAALLRRPVRAHIVVSLLLLVVIGLTAQPSGIRIIPPSEDPILPPEKTNQITQHAITWYFAEPVEYGRFVNGDHWVIGPVTIVNIDPLSTVGSDGWTPNGSMLNPHRGLVQGYDSQPTAGGYSAANNVGRPNGNTLSASNPLVIGRGNSLVSAKSRPTPNNRPQLTDASVLTVLASPPPVGSFRPAYTNGDKSIRWNVADINWNWLRGVQVNRSRLSSLPSPAAMANRVRRVWLDHSEDWTFSRIHPSNNMPDYGRDIAKIFGDVALTILLDFPRADIEPALIGALQVGIDTFGLAEMGQAWRENGGIFLGRKLPIVLAGMVFNDAAMLDVANANRHFIFQEDQQTNYVSRDLVNVSQSGLISDGGCWNPDLRGANIPYTNGTIGWPEWGIRFSSWINNQCSASTWAPDFAWNATYRLINSAGTTGNALAATIMGARNVWNWGPFFGYHDRFVRGGKLGEHGAWIRNGGTNFITHLTYDMWEAFRADYGALWQP